MKDVRLILLVRPILRPGRGSTCCGVKATTVHPVSARGAGSRRKAFRKRHKL